MYLPVPAFGYLCDRLGPGIPSCLSGIFFGLGYLLAAFAYRSGPPPSSGGVLIAYGLALLEGLPDTRAGSAEALPARLLAKVCG